MTDYLLENLFLLLWHSFTEAETSATKEFSVKSSIIILPTAIIQMLPIVTSYQTETFAPNQRLSLFRISRAFSNPLFLSAILKDELQYKSR